MSDRERFDAWLASRPPDETAICVDGKRCWLSLWLRESSGADEDNTIYVSDDQYNLDYADGLWHMLPVWAVRFVHNHDYDVHGAARTDEPITAAAALSILRAIPHDEAVAGE